jgi:hypothetical protein
MSRVVTTLCAIAIFIAWMLAEPSNQVTFIRWVVWLAVGFVVAFVIYVGLRAYCGRFRKPSVNAGNQPTGGGEVIWGGFWITQRARQAVRTETTVEAFLAGNLYRKEDVWPPLSLTVSAMVTAVVLLATLVCGTAALSTAATAAQVALTKRPAREVFGPADVPGLAPSKSTSPEQRSGKDPK